MQQPVSEALGECRAPGQHDIAKQRFPKVHVRPVDCIDHDLMYSWIFEANDLRVEQDLRRAISLRTNLSTLSLAILTNV